MRLQYIKFVLLGEAEGRCDMYCDGNLEGHLAPMTWQQMLSCKH
jgi:hypothetical protein